MKNNNVLRVKKTMQCCSSVERKKNSLQLGNPLKKKKDQDCQVPPYSLDVVPVAPPDPPVRRGEPFSASRKWFVSSEGDPGVVVVVIAVVFVIVVSQLKEKKITTSEWNY